MKWILGLCALAVLVGGIATITMPAQTVQPDEATLKLLPIEATGIASIDVVGLRNTPLVEGLLKQRGYPTEVQRFIDATGFLPDRDIKKVTVARIGRDRMVAIVAASYDRFKIEQFLRDRNVASQTYLGRVLYAGQSGAGSSQMSYSFIDDLIVGGNDAAVRQVIDRMASPAQNATQNTVLMGMITKVQTGNQVWAVGTVDADLLGNAPGSLPPQLNVPAAGLMNVLKTLTAGSYQMRIDQDVHAKAIGTFSDSNAARSTADLLRGLISLVKLQGTQLPAEMVQLLNGVRIDNADGSLTIQFDAPGDLLKGFGFPGNRLAD